MRRLTLALAGLSVAACTLTPPAPLPVVAVGEHYAEAANWTVAQPADGADRGSWWLHFDDAQLNELEAALNDANPTLRIALARLEEAQASARAAAGAQWPKLSTAVGANRTQPSTQGPSYNPSRAGTYNDLSAGLALNYEPDLFGRLRAAAAGNRALAEAAAGDLRSLRLALAAELAADYFQLRILDSTVDALDVTVHDDERALALTEALFHGGALAVGDVAQSRAQLEAARTQQTQVRLQRVTTEHALAVLLGRAPSEWHLPAAPLPSAVTLPSVRPGQPSTLLQRRPDVAAAERRVAAAATAVGIAKSTYFPVFTLGAALGRESLESGTWFTAPARFWSVAPGAALTLLDGGQRRAQVAGASAALTEATESYRETVLGAYQEVEDNLARVRDLGVEQASAEANVAASETAWAQARHRYDAGAATYLEVAAAQNGRLTARLTALSVAQQRILATTQLVRALGGTWE